MGTKTSPGRAALDEFEWTQSEDPSTELVQAISDVRNDDIATLDPLFQVVDPDALDQLLAQTHGPESQRNCEIQLEYHGYQIVVKSTGEGYIYDQSEGSP